MPKLDKVSDVRPSEMTFLESFLLNISVFYLLLNNEDKYYYLQFNVTTKILEIWSLQIVRKGTWQCPPVTTRLNVFS
jgi:hypothetical protein